MIDFTTLQGLTIPEGVVTQITDGNGNVIWAVASESGEPIVLEVEKKAITSYAGETSYSDNCVLLDIYPKKSNSTVNVTYGGFTKTLTFSGTNAQQVFFGTFNGVADEVETPASGTLTIEGGYSGFTCGVYQNGSKSSNQDYCSCITAVMNWGAITKIPTRAFYNCTKLALTELPNGLISIGERAFYGCTGISIGEIPEGVIEIGVGAFSVEHALSAGNNVMPQTIILPSTITQIGARAFSHVLNGEAYRVAQRIIIRAIAPPTIGDEVFGGYYESTSGTTTDSRSDIFVPVGCGEAYKAAWSEYTSGTTDGRTNKIEEAS